MIYCKNNTCDLNSTCQRYTEMNWSNSKIFKPFTIKDSDTDELMLNCEGFINYEA